MTNRSQKSRLLLRECLYIKSYLCQHTSTAEMVEDSCKFISEPFFSTISDEDLQTRAAQVDIPHECDCMKYYFVSICLFLSYYSKYFPHTYSQDYIVCINAVIVLKWIYFLFRQFWQTLKIWNKSCISTSIMNSTNNITLKSQQGIWFPIGGKIYPWSFHPHYFLRNKGKLEYFSYSFENAKQL